MKETLPQSVVEEDRRLESSAESASEALAKHRWHWTLDESKLFLRAVYPSTRHTNLFHWWRFHSHLFGS